MCGIIAVVRRPTDRTPPAAGGGRSACSKRPRPTLAGPGAAVRRRRRSPRPRPRVGRGRRCCCAGVPGVPALRRATGRCSPRVEHRARALDRPGGGHRRATSTRWTPTPRPPTPGRARGGQRRPGRAEGRGVGHRPRPAAHGRGPSTSSPGGDAGAGRDRRRTPRSSRRCRRSTASRCGAATRPGCTCSCGATGSTSTSPALRARARPTGPPTRCSARWRVRTPDGHLELRLQGGGRDRRAGRQHRARCGRRSPADDLLRRGARRRHGRGRGARPHPLGERRHHLPAQRPPAQLRGARREPTGPTSPPCSTATSTTSPTSRPPRRCASPPRSPPTPR